MATVQPNVETDIMNAALAAMQVLDGAFANKFSDNWQNVLGGLERMIWLREKGTPHLFVTERDGAFEISDPAEEALFLVGRP